MSASSVAQCVQSVFDTLPVKAKPRKRDGNVFEWVPLSGIVLSKDGLPLKCVSLGTGMKCLPQKSLPHAHGTTLHDWHAEILAIRGFNRWLLDECALVIEKGPEASPYLARRSPLTLSTSEYQPFAIRDDVKIHMYCSEAPCGDASMELVMDAQADSTPWDVPDALPLDGEQPGLVGRGYFSKLGVVRRKPSRPDAPVTASKSCTDKLCLKQCTSLLASVTAVLVHPENAYIHTLVLPASQYVPEAADRAFGPTGRMSAVLPRPANGWEGGYVYKPFTVEPTTTEFRCSRRMAPQDYRLASTNVSAVYTSNFQEVLIAGVLQGRKQFDRRGASRLSRISMWSTLHDIVAAESFPLLADAAQQPTYRDFKEMELLQRRRQVIHGLRQTALTGWSPNTGDEDWSIV